jgi:hypothetical protein
MVPSSVTPNTTLFKTDMAKIMKIINKSYFASEQASSSKHASTT